MENNWNNKIIKNWEDIAPEIAEYFNYIHETIEEFEKKIQALENHTDIHGPYEF
tara:strand:+ start:329 stop:490 length:162 start_codon:yes stop_codon:yes gene_type:complete